MRIIYDFDVSLLSDVSQVTYSVCPIFVLGRHLKTTNMLQQLRQMQAWIRSKNRFG
jgi:hypothetical protein